MTTSPSILVRSAPRHSISRRSTPRATARRKAFKREADGLRITLAPGEPETGWKTPPQLRFGGDFTISANFVIKKLPKPAQEDGAAIGMAIAFQDPNQPDVTLVRVLEPNGSDVYRSIEKRVATRCKCRCRCRCRCG